MLVTNVCNGHHKGTIVLPVCCIMAMQKTQQQDTMDYNDICTSSSHKNHHKIIIPSDVGHRTPYSVPTTGPRGGQDYPRTTSQPFVHVSSQRACGFQQEHVVS